VTGSPSSRRVEPITLAAELDSLAEVVRYVRATAGLAGLPEQQANRLRLAVEELVTNVVTHAREPKQIELAGGVDGDGIWLRVADSAAPFDPTSVAPPADLDRPLAEREPGGLGLYLARSMVDQLSYEYADGRNRTTVRLRRDLPA
jgi:serine/threonine-protein kinase RsbW